MPLDSRDAAHLWDVVYYGKGIVQSLEGVTFEQFMSDETLRLATGRRLEIIREAARRMSDEVKESIAGVP